MKKMAVGILAAVFVFSAGTVNALAAGGCRGYGYQDCVGACNYADENGDGICDSCGQSAADCAGRYYTDENGDGVCDNYASGSCHHRGTAGAGRNRGGCHR